MKKKSSLSILMYHYVRDLKASRYPSIKGLDLALFRQQLDYLSDEGFVCIDAELLLSALSSEATLPDKAVLLTFDDGYIDHYTNVFPELKKRGISAFFSMPGRIIAEKKLLDVNKIHFLLASMGTEEILANLFERLDYYRGKECDYPSNDDLYAKLASASRYDTADVIFIKRVLQVELDEQVRKSIVDDLFFQNVAVSEQAFAKELYMKIEQVAHMRREGMCFGIHGYDHYWMNRLTCDELDEDIEKALNTFTGIVDPHRWICCYPYGSYSKEVERIIQKRGAAAGFTTKVDQARLDDYGRFELPRFDTNDFPPISYNYRRMMR